MGSTKALIISPQAGFGNRLRAVASALVLARQTGRQLYHAWHPVDANDPRPHVAELQKTDLEQFFQPLEQLLPYSPQSSLQVEACYSEWHPGNYWYQFQSGVQRMLGLGPHHAKGISLADAIADSEAKVVLLETSLPERLSAAKGGAASDAMWIEMLRDAYGLLKPRADLQQIVENVPAADVCITIRRGDLLKYFPEANQDLALLRNWAVGLAEGRRVAVFSDDRNAQDLIAKAISARGFDLVDTSALHLPGLPRPVAAFIDFLYISRCPIITGTPKSSFAYEAAQFGRRAYHENLDHALLSSARTRRRVDLREEGILPEVQPVHRDDEPSLLARHYGPEGAEGRNHIQLYTQYFSPLKEQPVTLLEIGFGGYDGSSADGTSLRMWRDYFSKGTIFGLDMFARNLEPDPGIRSFRGSKADPRMMADLINSADGNAFDIIIDNGNCESEHVIATFLMMFQFVREGGWYVIANVQMPHRRAFDTPDGRGSHSLLTTEFLMNLVDGLNFQDMQQPGCQPDHRSARIAELHFHQDIVLVRKGGKLQQST